jgi:hypothetical protein
MRPLIAAVFLFLPLALAGGAGAQSPTLFGTVDPGFSIRLAEASRSPVRVLNPGTTRFRSRTHADAWTYSYRSDATPALRGSFRVRL